MNKIVYENLSMNNTEKYSIFFEKEVRINNKNTIIDNDSINFLIERNSVKYMKDILLGKQNEESFTNNEGIKYTPLFNNNFTQLVIEKESGEVVGILDAREFHKEGDNGNYLNIWWVFINENFKKRGIASKLYKNLEKHGRKKPKIIKISSSTKKTNIASCNFHTKMGYKLIESTDKINKYSLSVSKY